MRKLFTLLIVCVIGFANAQQSTTLLYEDFSNGFPSSWYMNNNGFCPNGFFLDNAATYINGPLDPVIQGDFMVAESYDPYAMYPCNQNTEILTTGVNAQGFDSVFVYFDMDFDPFTTGNDTIQLWTNDGFQWWVEDWTDQQESGSYGYNITQYAISSILQVAFLYSGYDGNYCAFDNIEIFGVNYTQPLVASATSTNVSCNGGNNGTATVFVSGGTPGYTYLWNNGQTTNMAINLVAGTYTCTVTDANGATVTTSVTITEPSVLMANISTTPTSSCTSSDGSATITVSGGTPPYTYFWSNGSTSAGIGMLAAGAYSCTITDANGCVISTSATINSGGGSGPTVTATQTNVLCNGGNDGTATLNITGGSAGSTTTLLYEDFSNGFPSSWYMNNNGFCPNGFFVDNAATYINGPLDPVIQGDFMVAESYDPYAMYPCNQNTEILTTGVNAQGFDSVFVYFDMDFDPFTTGNDTIQLWINDGFQWWVEDWTDQQESGSYGYNITQYAISSILQVAFIYSGYDGNYCAFDNIEIFGVNYGSNPTILWTNGATTSSIANLYGGSYGYTVTDPTTGCSTSGSLTISEPTAIVVTEVNTDVSCNGSSDGSSTLQISGGTAPYNEDWGTVNPTALAAGSYPYTVTDANQCQIQGNVTISEPTAIVIIESNTDVSCNGGANGSSALQISGGTAPYTPDWGTANPTGLAAGSYPYTVTDANQCQIQGNVAISEPAAISITETNMDVSCYGGSDGSSTLQISGGTAPYNEDWGTVNPTALAAGSYPYTVTDANQCQMQGNVTISEPAQLIVSVLVNGNDLEATASGGIAPYTYLWNPGNQTTSIITPLTSGSYACTVTDANGCTSFDSTGFTSTNIHEINVGAIRIYPNPSDNLFTIGFESNIEQMLDVKIINAIGEVIFSENLENFSGSYKQEVSLIAYSKGIYFLKVKTDIGIITKKLILH